MPLFSCSTHSAKLSFFQKSAVVIYFACIIDCKEWKLNIQADAPQYLCLKVMYKFSGAYSDNTWNILHKPNSWTFQFSINYRVPVGTLASFRGSPRARTEGRGEPGKIYHVRNVIGGENLIMSGRTNELAHALWILVLLRKLYSRQSGTRQHCATLSGSMASHGKHFRHSLT